jgi:hypothetical protein
MPFPSLPDPIGERAHEQARWHPERFTLELATAGAAKVLGVDHSATRALFRAAITMSPAAFQSGSWPVRNRHRVRRASLWKGGAVTGGRSSQSSKRR